MKKSILIIIFLNLALNSIIAQNFIRKFNSVKDFVSIDNIVYFNGDDGIHGKELWRSDGTKPGTFLLKDINTSYQGGDPSALLVYHGEVYFTADDGIHGDELWKTNGTEAGTIMVANIRPDNQPYYIGSRPSNFLIYNNYLFFTATDDGNDSDLWRTDGTDNGTVKVYENICCGLTELTAVDNYLYFISQTGPNRMLRYNDSNGETEELAIDDYYTIAELNSFSNALYFITHTTDRHDIRFYKLTNGNSFTLLKEYTQPSYGDIYIDNFCEVEQEVYFSIRTDFNSDPETDALWKTNGTSEGTIEIKSFGWDSHWSNSFINDFINFNNHLYFRSGEKNGNSLWESNGTESGTNQISNVRLSSTYGQKTISNDLMYFCGTSGGSNNFELWSSDGTSTATNLFAEIKEEGSSSPSNLIDVNETLFFTADDGDGLALWNNEFKPEITVYLRFNQIISNEILEFNTVKVDSIDMKSIVIENTGNKELLISKITSSGGDFYIENKNNIIFPNEKDTLNVYFFPGTEGNKEGKITISNNDNNESDFIIQTTGIAEGYMDSPSSYNNNIVLTNEIDYENTADTITISNYSINEGLPPNTIVGSLEILNQSISDWSFSFITGVGDDDNNRFYIIDNKIYANQTFNYKDQNTCVVRIRATHNTETINYEQFFIFKIIDQNEFIVDNDCGKTFYSLNYALSDVEFINSNTVFAVGDDGVILKSINAGESWVQINSGTDANFYEIQFVSENVGYISRGWGDVILKTENEGDNWFPLEINNPDYSYISNLFFITEDKGFVVGGDGKIFRTEDGGRTWNFQRKGNDDFSSVFFVDESIGYICGRSNTLYKTIDFGENWIPIDMDEFGWEILFKDVVFTNEQTGYVISNEGKLIKTIDSGTSWTQVYDIHNYANDIYFVNEEVGYIIAGEPGGGIYKTEDAGNTWEQINNSGSSSLSGISFNPSGQKGVVVGDAAGYGNSSQSGRIVLCSDDEGTTWTRNNYFNGDNDFVDCAFFGDIGYVFGGDYYSGGVAFKTYDRGITWDQIPVPPLNTYSYGINKCYFLNKDTIFAVADSVYMTTDGGDNWRAKDEFDRNHQYSFIDFDTVYRLHPIYTDIVSKSTDGGETWVEIYDANSWLTHICFLNEKFGFLLGYDVIIKTDDGGLSWTEYHHDLSVVLNSIYFINENTLLVGGNDGTLLKSVDAGNTWTSISLIIKSDIIDFEFYDQNNGVLLACSDGGSSTLYSTSDGGDTWQYIQQLLENTFKVFIDSKKDIYIPGDNGTLLKYAQSSPPSQAGYILGDDLICEGEIIDFHTPSSSFFNNTWSINNGQSVSYLNNNATITWEETGEYLIELTSNNSCGTGLSQYLTVNVMPLPVPEIIGMDTVSSSQTSVIYTSIEYFEDRIMWGLKGAKSATILGDKEIKVTWESSDCEIDLVQTSIVGCRQKDSKNVFHYIGIDEPDQDIEIDAYPNPITDYVHLSFSNSNEESITITLLNTAGKILSSYETSDTQVTLFVGNLSKGLYLLNVNNGVSHKSIKLILK